MLCQWLLNVREKNLAWPWWRYVTLGQVAIIGAQKLPVVRPQGGNQLFAGLYLQRLTHINLAHAIQILFRDGAGEHPKRPGEIWTVKPSQLVNPHPNRTDTPGGGSPPAVLTRTQIHLPTLHHELPL